MARIEQSIELNVPVRTAYDQLLRFEQYPRFMDDVVQVRQLDETHVHWHSKAGNVGMEWDAEITEQVPEHCIAWRHTSMPHYAGRIDLQSLAPDRTKVTVSINYEHGEQMLAQHGDAERALAERAEQGLARFKKFIESQHRESSARQRKGNDTQAAGDQQRLAATQPQAGQQQQQTGQQQQPRAGTEERSWIPNLMQLWGEPLSMMRKMSEEMDHLVGKFMPRPAQLYGKGPNASGTTSAWAPAVEVAQSEDKLVICAELPGVQRDDVRVEIKNDRVTIEGERHPAPQAQELQRSERNYGHFYRVIALPEGAEPDAASAALHDGVLEITVPVPEGGRRARRVDIRPQ